MAGRELSENGNVESVVSLAWGTEVDYRFGCLLDEFESRLQLHGGWDRVGFINTGKSVLQRSIELVSGGVVVDELFTRGAEGGGSVRCRGLNRSLRAC